MVTAASQGMQQQTGEKSYPFIIIIIIIITLLFLAHHHSEHEC